MASSSTKSTLALIILLAFVNFSIGARPRILDLWIPDQPLLTCHGGEVLQGNIPISIIWYGPFNDTQKSIVTDFIESLTSNPWAQQNPSVSEWWSKLVQLYPSIENGYQQTQVTLGDQVDNWYSMGTSLNMSQISDLASSVQCPENGITLVFTSDDVLVQGFGMNHCGVHGYNQNSKSTFIWVGNPISQCPGQCAWPFHQPEYGLQNPPLLPPNGDVGIEGIVLNLAILLAGTVTNPRGDGYYQGPQEAPLEASSACAGVYGAGAFPGYPGQLLTCSDTGASYNANGAYGRRYMLPAIMDPTTAYCYTPTP